MLFLKADSASNQVKRDTVYLAQNVPTVPVPKGMRWCLGRCMVNSKHLRPHRGFTQHHPCAFCRNLAMWGRRWCWRLDHAVNKSLCRRLARMADTLAQGYMNERLTRESTTPEQQAGVVPGVKTPGQSSRMIGDMATSPVTAMYVGDEKARITPQRRLAQSAKLAD